jgi:hypothetical protein
MATHIARVQAKFDLLKGRMAELRKLAWDESKHRRAADGRFIPIGRFFHGSSQQALESIRSEGLVPGKGKGEFALFRQGKHVDLFTHEVKSFGRFARIKGAFAALILSFGKRRHVVYISKSWNTARRYAAMASAATGSPGVLLRVRVPKSQIHRLEQDVLPNSAMLRGSIPPQWIDVYTEDFQTRWEDKTPSHWRRLAKQDAEVFYVVLHPLKVSS